MVRGVRKKKVNLIGIREDDTFEKKDRMTNLDFEMGGEGLGGLLQDDDSSHGAQHVGGSAFVSAKDGLVVHVELEGAVMLGIEDLNVFVGLEGLVVLDPSEIRSRLRFGRAGDVDSPPDESIGLSGLFRVLVEPARLICHLQDE